MLISTSMYVIPKNATFQRHIHHSKVTSQDVCLIGGHFNTHLGVQNKFDDLIFIQPYNQT